MKRNLKVLIGGAPFGDKNFGEDAILATDIGMLRRIDPTIEVTVLTHEPERTQAWLDVKAFPRGNGRRNPRFFQHLRLMRSTNVFAFGGTTMLSAGPDLPLRMILLAKLLGKPVFTFPCGVDPIPSPVTRFFMRLLLNKVDLLLARDEETKTLLIEYGVKIPIIVTADQVLTLQPETAPPTVGTLLEENPCFTRNRPLAVISLVYLGEVPFSEFAKAGNYLVEDRGYSLLFFPAQPNDPQDVTLKVMERISRRDRCFTLSRRYFPDQVLALLRHVDLVISSRLHLLIPSVLANVPIIGLSRSAKISNFFRRIGEEWLLEMQSVTFQVLKTQIDRIQNDPASVKRKLREKTELLTQQAGMSQNFIATFLGTL
jgi:polysaccharide pyruvyl transferase WcaK-like protein